MSLQEIIHLLPYQPPFLFVDHLESISENGVVGSYMFPKESFFYRGHFKNHPVTPGVILTECMAQIGVVCLGIFLMNKDKLKIDQTQIALTSNHIDFFIPVYPGEEVNVFSEKVYFRFHKLKCKVKMMNQKGEMVCRGEISGMISNYEK